MAKYRVYSLMTAAVLAGEYEADSKEEAINMAENDSNAVTYAFLCHQCSHEVEIGDVYEFEAEEIDET